MNDDSDSGFSFGRTREPMPPRPDADDLDDIDAIEVDGEPVSRNEARNMGLVLDSKREFRSATTKMRLERLPSDVGIELAKKMEWAWEHLKRNEIEEALTLAQEVVWEYPTLVAAKLVIARCFIHRKEYEKGLAILRAIPDADKTAEVYYYIGMCLSRIGKILEAIEALKKSQGIANDMLVRKRAGDLLLHLQGEQIVCPGCGKKTLYDSMVEVGDHMVCTNCAKSGAIPDDDEEYDEEYDDDDDIGPNTRRRRRLRPPMTKADILLRFAAALFVVFLIGVGGYILYIVSPEYYSLLRSYLPASWTFIPQADKPDRPSGGQAKTAAPQSASIIPGLFFDSQPVTTAVAGVELRHRLSVESMRNQRAKYSVFFDPAPAGRYSLDAASGAFSWTPAPEDAGKTFEVTFSGQFNLGRPNDQVNQVAVYSGFEFRRLGAWPNHDTDSTRFILTEDLTGDATPELVLISGDYWKGGVAVLSAGESGGYGQIDDATLSGHPVGAGIITAGAEKWVAVADYWNSRIRYFALRDGRLSEMALTIDLPGEPVLADFNRELSISAVLCRSGDSLRIIAYRQDGQLHFTRIGEWEVPDSDVVWRRLLILPTILDAPPVLALLGGNIGDSVLLFEQNVAAPRSLEHGRKGTLIDAVQNSEKLLLHCLVDNDGTAELVTLDPAAEGAARFDPVPLGVDHALGGLFSGPLIGDDAADVAVFTSDRFAVAFASPDSLLHGVNFWPLPAPARIFGKVAPLPRPDGKGVDLVFADAGGGLWSVGLKP